MFSITRLPLLFIKKAQPSFRHRLQAANEKTLQNIYKHPFNQQLFNETLEPEDFGRYLRDDYWYLSNFSRCLHLLAGRIRITSPDLSQHLAYLASDIIAGEQDMLEKYGEHLKQRIIPGRAIRNYVDYLNTMVQIPHVGVALSSIEPCFTSYIGTSDYYRSCGLVRDLDSHRYGQWIGTYEHQSFRDAGRILAQSIDLIGEASSEDVQVQMIHAFKTALSHEEAFFDEVSSHFNASEHRMVPFK